MPKIGRAPQWQTTHLFWKLDCEQSLFCCEIRLARTRKKVSVIDKLWAAKPQSLFAVTGAPDARRSQLRPSSLVDHVRFFPVRSSRETARSLFENENLLKNLSSQIFQLSTVFYNNLLSLAWKKLGSYKRVFTVYASESKIKKKKKNYTNIALRSQELSRFGGGGYSCNHHYFEWTKIRKLNGGGDWGEFSSRKHFFFGFASFFLQRNVFGKTLAHLWKKKKIETKILWRYSLGARVVPSPSTQIGELSFTTRKILPFYKSKERKSIELSLKCMGSKPFPIWVLECNFFRMTNCSYRYTSYIEEDSKEINRCFLKH